MSAALLIAVPLLPLLAALAALAAGGRLPGDGGWPLVGALTMALAALAPLHAGGRVAGTWFSVGRLRLTVGLEATGPTWFVACVVAATALFVCLYAIGYVQGESSARQRFFAAVGLFAGAAGSDMRRAVRGMGRRSPWPAVALTLALFSLAGIPPLAGFAGKVMLLGAALDGGMTWLAVVAAANMAVALVYYVGVVAEMYFATDAHGPAMAPSVGYDAAMLLTTAGSLAIGILPALGLAPAALGAALLR